MDVGSRLRRCETAATSVMLTAVLVECGEFFEHEDVHLVESTFRGCKKHLKNATMTNFKFN